MASGNVAMLVSLLLVQETKDDDWKGLTKEELVDVATKSEIKEDDFAGGTTQTGQYIYNGASGLKSQLCGGQVPLIVKTKQSKYKLTNTHLGGLELARDLHDRIHEEKNLNIQCKCGRS